MSEDDTKERYLDRRKVSFTFYLPDDKDLLKKIVNMDEFTAAFYDISNACRKQIKHGDDPKVADFAEEIRSMVQEHLI